MTYGPEVAELNDRIGLTPDPQQELGLDLIFAINPDGSPASFAGCVICCRQNMKTGLFKQAVLGWLEITEDREIVWSAHEMSTTTEAQRDLETLITESYLGRRLATGPTNGIFYGSIGQRIEFANGQQIMFKARTKTGGRGLARGKLVLDEAFALTPGMMGSIVPTLATKPNAQMLYGSSAGLADSEVLFDVRERGRAGKSPRLFYLEWLAPKEPCRNAAGEVDKNCRHPKDAPERGLDCALDREHLRRAANPAISTGRITLERLEDFRQELPPAEFARECLGWWDEPASAQQVIASDVWQALKDDGPPDGTAPAALAVDMSHDRVLAIAGCWATEDGAHIELVALDYVTDTLGAAEWLKGRAGRRIPVVVDSASPAASMVPALKAARVKVIQTGPVDMGKACGLFYDETTHGRLTHAGQAQLDSALLGASKRAIREAGSWAWDRKDPEANIAPLVAATLARFGAAGSRRRSTGGVTTAD